MGAADTIVSTALAVLIVACIVTIAYVVVLLVLSAPVPRVRWAVRQQGLTVFSEEVFCMLLRPGFTVSAEVVPLTADGVPAAIDGSVAWATSADGVVSIAVDATDSKKATITALAGDGVRVTGITATFDADLGAGVRTLTAAGEVTVAPDEAVTAEIRFGTPEPPAPVNA